MNGNAVPGRLAQVTLWLIVPLFAACGGGGGDSPTPVDTTPPPVVEMGVFIDSPVQGLTYQSGSEAAGTTDANGMFDYTVGETLSFSVGGVQLGTLPDGKSLITPNDFGAAAENIARLLQTLDADGEHINGIDLTAAATALENMELDASAFTSDAITFETTIQPVLDTALGAGAVLIDADTALANLAAALDSTFDVAELAGTVLIIDLPSENDTGIAVFDPLVDPNDSGSSVTMFMLSDTIAEGGDGTTTVMDWSVGADGILSVVDPFDGSVITIEKVGGSLGIISIQLTQGSEELVGSFLVPANGVAMDLTGDNGRSFDATDASGTTLITFFPDGDVSVVENGLVFIDDWSLDTSGSLITITDTVDQISLTVLLDGSLAVGGTTMTFATTNLSGDLTNPIYQLDEMFIGSVTPVTFPDPSTAVRYDFTTSATAISPGDPALEAIFAGGTVTGSFSYANWVPPVAVLDGPNLPGAALYVGSMLDIAGTVSGMNFSDSLGLSVVGNDRFQPGDRDFLSVVAGILETGFEVGGYTLTNVRLFWIEGDTTPDDFVQSDLLPTALPVDLSGRASLDFELTSDPLIKVSVFFADMSVTISP